MILSFYLNLVFHPVDNIQESIDCFLTVIRIDSLYNEYPSGLILFWKPQELPVLRNIASNQKSKRIPDFLQERRRLITKAINDYMREIGADYFPKA